MTHDEIKSLLGVFALDAVEGGVREELSVHLLGCEECRLEVQQHHEVASLLAVSAGDDVVLGELSAPLWNRIAQSIAVAPVVQIDAQRGARTARQRRLLRLVSAAAALLLVGVVALQVQVGRLNTHVNALTTALLAGTASNELAQTLRGTNHVVISLNTIHGVAQASVVVRSDGLAFFVNNSLPALNRSSTFQLWALSRGKIVSLGVLGSAPHVVTFRFERPMTTIMINVEPVGGTSQPTTAVIAQGVVA